MREGLFEFRDRPIRRSLTLFGLALAALFGGSGAAYAIDPFDNFTCALSPRVVSGLDIVPPSDAANVVIPDGFELVVTVTNGQSGTITLNGTPLISLPAAATATIPGPRTVTLVTPDIGGGGGLFDNNGSGNSGVMSIRFECVPVTGTPRPGATSFYSRGFAHQSDVAEREPMRSSRLWYIMANRLNVDFWATYAALYARIRDLQNAIYEKISEAEAREELEQAQAELETMRASPEYDAFRGVQLEQQIRNSVPGAYTGVEDFFNYMPTRQSPIDASVSAISQFFDMGRGSFGTTIPLQSTNPDWTFDIILDGAIIDRTFAALGRRTTVGSATLATTYKWDENTILGGGLKLGAARSEFTGTPAATISSTQVGLDLAIARMLTPDLTGVLYAGYEFGSHVDSVGGINSPYISHTLKLGGELEGKIRYDLYTITPSISALLQSYHQPGFTDGTGALVAPAEAFDLDVIGGASIERDFRLEESGVTVTPSLALNGWLDYAQNTAGVTIPTDAFKLQAVAGVSVTWDSGASLAFSADISGGATTMMYGSTVHLSVPIN